MGDDGLRRCDLREAKLYIRPWQGQSVDLGENDDMAVGRRISDVSWLRDRGICQRGSWPQIQKPHFSVLPCRFHMFELPMTYGIWPRISVAVPVTRGPQIPH